MTIFYVITAILTLLSLMTELSRDLMMLQQNSYRTERYRKWLSTSGDSTSLIRLSGLVIFFVALASSLFGHLAAALMAIFAVINIYRLKSRKYKKPLVWTARARRIYAVAIVLSVVIAALAAIFIGKGDLQNSIYVGAVTLMGLYCASHGVIISANFLLQPVEKAINRRYYNDAAARLASMPSLRVIGITGSYGKTSTKHYLHRILSEKYDTLMTPGSYNTTLGVIRTIREQLKPYNEVFICEMGAKQPGDIKEICDLVHPTAAIITAVGPQHLESFKTIENVQRTKFELADCLPSDGFAVVNNDFEKIADRPVDNCTCIRYAVADPAGADYYAEEIRYSATGTDFTARDRDGWALRLHTRLVGECNISNLLAAVIVARRMGLDDNTIKYAVEQIEQVEHRLNIKRTPGGIIIIDDAFNSNPVGSSMALDVLASMTEGRRIIITPGMIELGERQYELNCNFGEKIATSADVAIIVGTYNRDAICEGLKDGGMNPDKVHAVDTFTDAQTLLQSFATAGDIVLYENDLPDTFK